MEEKKQIENFRGIRIQPMTEFWLDCYSTAIYSIMLSNCNVNKAGIYCNNYTYIFDVNEGKNLGKIYIKTDLESIEAGLLQEKKDFYVSKEENIANAIKGVIDDNRILMLGIDMFYGITDTSQWNKHHIRHYIIVEGYDDENKLFYLLETGESGYKEYTMSYEKLSIAAQNFADLSHSYVINSAYKFEMYDIRTIKNNAKKIIDSISNVLSHMDQLWHVESRFLVSMRDEVDTHLKSIANRQRVNQLLFRSFTNSTETLRYVEQFKALEKEYRCLRHRFLELCDSREYMYNERLVKECLANLLNREAKIWDEVSKGI